MRCHYFVSYHVNLRGGWAFGMCDCDTSNPIENFKDIQAVADYIKSKDTSFTNVIILNWRELDAPQVEDEVV